MSDEDFGDDAGADDQYDASGANLDPEAVTIRMHEERVKRGDSDLGYWSDLTDDERAIARMIGTAVAERMSAGDNARTIAKFLDELRDYLGVDSSFMGRREERAIIQSLIDNSEREGTLR